MRSFPTVLYAGLLGFDKREYFEAPKSAQQAPNVDFTS
ncbi:MAG: LemA family protein [candidate division KSB1 bacterium]|nr:LemA family protein [candidate division KSB1 bacterium]